MGSDAYGRDQFSRFLYGGQISLLAGLIAAILSVSIGILAGGIAGYYGGWIDEILMRGGELFLALPWLYLLFAVRAALPLHISQWQVFLLLVSVMGLIGWARPARLIRGVVLSAKERNFVLAARGFGASDAYLLRRHVLPQTYAVLLTQITLLVPQYVLAEVTLTFLGLGVGEPMPSWGALLSFSAAVLGSFFVLVDVPARAPADPALRCFLRRRRCSAGTSQIRAAVKTGKSLLRVDTWGEFGYRGRALSCLWRFSAPARPRAASPQQAGEERMVTDGAPRVMPAAGSWSLYARNRKR